MGRKSIHCKLGVLDASGSMITISPKTTGEDIEIRENTFGSGKTLQELVDNLGQIAFNKTFMGIDDTAVNSTDKCWSADKITKEFNSIKDVNNNAANIFKNKCGIIAKGISDQLGRTVSPTSSPASMAENISTIATNKTVNGTAAGRSDALKGDATPGDVLYGKTFTSANGIGQSGTIPIKGTFSSVLKIGARTTIPAGYYSSIRVETCSVKSYSNTFSWSFEDAPTCIFLFHIGPLDKYYDMDNIDLLAAGFNYFSFDHTLKTKSTGIIPWQIKSAIHDISISKKSTPGASMSYIPLNITFKFNKGAPPLPNAQIPDEFNPAYYYGNDHDYFINNVQNATLTIVYGVRG